MSASTVTQKYVASSRFYAKVKNLVQEQKLPGANPASRLIPFEFTSDTIATTSLDEADDVVEFFTFPNNCRLWALRVYVPTALESGTPASETDFLAGSTVLINNSQVYRANGSSDELDAGLIGVDVSGLTFQHKVVTPGDTEVAGTIQVFGLVSVGRDSDQDALSIGA